MLTINDMVIAGIEMIDDHKWRKTQHNTRKIGWERWIHEKHPELKLWEQLQPGHVLEYHKWLQAQYRPSTVNNYLNPVRKAATYVKLYHPEHAKELFVRNVIRAKYRPVAKRYLMADQLSEAIQHARDAGEPAVVAALMFGGLAGLDIGEIMRVQSGDINGGILHVRGEKNDYRPRVIPLCEPLARYAAAWSMIFQRMPLKTDGALSHKARMVLDGTGTAKADKTYRLVTLHDATRVTFVNLASQSGTEKDSGAETDYLKAYIGHAPESVLAKHYGDLTPREDDMPRLFDSKIAELKTRVVQKVEKKLQDVSFFC